MYRDSKIKITQKPRSNPATRYLINFLATQQTQLITGFPSPSLAWLPACHCVHKMQGPLECLEVTMGKGKCGPKFRPTLAPHTVSAISAQSKAPRSAWRWQWVRVRVGLSSGPYSPSLLPSPMRPFGPWQAWLGPCQVGLGVGGQMRALIHYSCPSQLTIHLTNCLSVALSCDK